MIQSSILIPTKNGGPEFEECLKAIYAQKVAATFEVVLVDSGSTDLTLELASRYPVRIVSIASLDFHHARTRNLLATLAKGEYLVFLSQDAIPADDQWLSSLLQNFEDPSIGAVYAKQIPKPNATGERHQVFSALYGEQRIVKRPGEGAKLGYKYYHFSNVSSAIRKEVWQATGFPEDMKVFEDVGIAKRILEAGWSIAYEPGARVYHSHNHRLSDVLRRYFDIGVVYQRLGIWSNDSRKSVRKDGWRALRAGFARKSSGNGSGAKGGSSLLTNAGKFIAVELGRRERYLPFFIKKKLSLHGLFD